MSAYLIFGASPEQQLAEAYKKIGTSSSGVDLINLGPISKIDEVRLLINSLSRKPYQSKKISIILPQAELLTVEAQNALLKTLEEPPGQSDVYLLTTAPTALLLTVRSRCLMVDLGVSPSSVTESELKQAWRQYQNYDMGQLFEIAAEARPNVWAELVRQLLIFQVGGDKLLTKSSPHSRLTQWVSVPDFERLSAGLPERTLRSFLSQAQQASVDLTSNVNHRLVMENLFLALPRPEISVIK